MQVSPLSEQIHLRAVEVSTRYKTAEADLIDILQQVEEHRVFICRGYSSLFDYVIKELGLSEATAYALIAVARKSREVPELKAQLQSGALNLSGARRIAPLLMAKTPEANAEWIKKASELTNRQLEKEIVKVRPEAATTERAFYVSEDRMKLELGLSENEMQRLRRVQDLLSQSRQRSVSLEETIAALTTEYLERHDPVEKAKRHQKKKDVTEDNPSETVGKQVSKPVAKKAGKMREPISAATLHQVNLRDQGRCTHTAAGAPRCNQARWTHVHHKIPVSEGGSNALDNLITLCSAHHRFWHHQNRPDVEVDVKTS